MMGLDFYAEQENSLDILIKFQDEQQQPESHTHEELFLPLADISVTSHHTALSLPHHSQTTDEQRRADQLVLKMRAACEQQERRATQLLGRAEGGRDAAADLAVRLPGREEARQQSGSVRSKRKPIRKRRNQ